MIGWSTRQDDPERQLIEEYVVHEEVDRGGHVISRSYSQLNLRYVHRYEMQYLLELSGYRIEALYGDFSRAAFKYAGEQIWVVRRA